MLVVTDGLVQQYGDAVVVQGVDGGLAVAGVGDQAEMAQQPQLVGDRGAFHGNVGGRRQTEHGSRRSCASMRRLGADRPALYSQASIGTRPPALSIRRISHATPPCRVAAVAAVSTPLGRESGQ